MTSPFTWLWSIKGSWRMNMVKDHKFCTMHILFYFYWNIIQHVIFSFLPGIEPWTFVQKLGDAVFIPAGCPHQVRNLKVICNIYATILTYVSLSSCTKIYLTLCLFFSSFQLRGYQTTHQLTYLFIVLMVDYSLMLVADKQRMRI